MEYLYLIFCGILTVHCCHVFTFSVQGNIFISFYIIFITFKHNVFLIKYRLLTCIWSHTSSVSVFHIVVVFSLFRIRHTSVYHCKKYIIIIIILLRHLWKITVKNNIIQLQKHFNHFFFFMLHFSHYLLFTYIMGVNYREVEEV